MSHPTIPPYVAGVEYGVEVSPVGEEGSATKRDVGKSPIWQGCINYFPRALHAVANVSDYGNRKYGEWGGFALVPNAVPRYNDALGRHLVKECTEGPYDDNDSGLSHAAQVAWNALARLEMMLRDKVIEDRRGNDIVDGKPVLGTAKVV